MEDKKPASPSKPSTEDKKKSSIQPGSGQQDEVKSNCTKPPTTNHLRDLFISLEKVPIVLSSSHTTPPVAPKSTRLIQDGDRYIFLVEDTRGTKVSSVPVGTPASATKGTDEGTETEGGNEEEGEEEAAPMVLCLRFFRWRIRSIAGRSAPTPPNNQDTETRRS